MNKEQNQEAIKTAMDYVKRELEDMEATDVSVFYDPRDPDIPTFLIYDEQMTIWQKQNGVRRLILNYDFSQPGNKGALLQRLEKELTAYVERDGEICIEHCPDDTDMSFYGHEFKSDPTAVIYECFQEQCKGFKLFEDR